MKAVGLFLTIQGGAGQIEHKKMRDRRFPSRIFTSYTTLIFSI